MLAAGPAARRGWSRNAFVAYEIRIPARRESLPRSVRSLADECTRRGPIPGHRLEAVATQRLPERGLRLDRPDWTVIQMLVPRSIRGVRPSGVVGRRLSGFFSKLIAAPEAQRLGRGRPGPRRLMVGGTAPADRSERTQIDHLAQPLTVALEAAGFVGDREVAQPFRQQWDGPSDLSSSIRRCRLAATPGLYQHDGGQWHALVTVDADPAMTS